MNALLFTQAQAEALIAANGDSPRQLIPREISAGRFILSDDVLQDPLFTDPENPWWPTLAQGLPATLTAEDLA